MMSHVLSYDVVFIDLAKAFNTVLHESIEKALCRKGVPSGVVRVVQSLYAGALTNISVGKTMTRAININAGVKQGCPLSPLLFNLILDELAERLEATGCGLELNELVIPAVAFADDFVSLAKDTVEMNVLMKVGGTFFEEKGLSVNLEKCQSLRVLPVKGIGKRSMKVLTRTHRWLR